MLKKLRNKLAPMTWTAYYELAKNYYNHYKTIKMKEGFKTFDGINYDENGINLYAWVMRQKGLYKQGRLDKEKEKLLDDIEATPQTLFVKRYSWEEVYTLAKTYYEYNGNLRVPLDFKTLDGIHYNEKGYNLYNWLLKQDYLYYTFLRLYRIAKNKDYADDLDKLHILRDLEEQERKIKKLDTINYREFINYKKEIKEQKRNKNKKK